jgi:hypothetical protein
MKIARVIRMLVVVVMSLWFAGITSALAQTIYEKVHILEAYSSFAPPENEFYNETPRHSFYSDTTIYLYIKIAVGDQAGSHTILHFLTNAAGQRVGEFTTFVLDAPSPQTITGYRLGVNLSAGVYFFHAVVIGPDGFWAFQNAPYSFIVEDRP